MLADNDNVGPDEPLRLALAVRLAFPHGGMTPSGLRREAARGRLAIERIAGKDFTTLRSIEEMRKLCRVKGSLPDSGSARPITDAPRPGSSSMTVSSTPLAAARLITQALRER